jgi:hypothetical protein
VNHKLPIGIFGLSEKTNCKSTSINAAGWEAVQELSFVAIPGPTGTRGRKILKEIKNPERGKLLHILLLL